MEIQEGDRVRVNLAPFIGSMIRANQSIPCEVLAVSGLQVHVRTEPPCRCVSLWVLSNWIEGYADEELEPASAAAVAG
jgi:hypothetical protein